MTYFSVFFSCWDYGSTDTKILNFKVPMYQNTIKYFDRETNYYLLCDDLLMFWSAFPLHCYIQKNPIKREGYNLDLSHFRSVITQMKVLMSIDFVILHLALTYFVFKGGLQTVVF